MCDQKTRGCCDAHAPTIPPPHTLNRYASIPIARRTGGLAATLADVADSSSPPAARNAFLFDDPTPSAAVTAVTRALDAYGAAPDWWSGELVPRAVGQDWSWARSAADYSGLYRQAVSRRRG